MQAKRDNSLNFVQGLIKPNDWLNKINFIKQSVLLNSSLIAVVADNKGGKTSFIQLFSETSFEDITVLILEAKKIDSLDELLKKLRYLLSAPNSQSISTFTDLVNQRQQHVLLLIDNAHELPIDLLREICTTKLQTVEEDYFHVCLVANQSINECFNLLESDYHSLEIQTIPLGNLTENETKSLVTQHMVSNTQGQFINEDQAKSFFNLTGGNISLINKHLPAFKKKFQTRLPEKTKFEQIVVSCCAVITVVASAYIWQNLPYIKVVVRGLNNSLLASNSHQKNDHPIPVLESKIPPYNLAVKYRSIQPPPLNQLIKIPDDQEEILEKMAIVDSVLSGPKLFKHAVIALPQVAQYQPKVLSSKQKTSQSPVDNKSEPLAKFSDSDNKLTSSVASLKLPIKKSKKSAKIMAKRQTGGKKDSRYTIQLLASKSKWNAAHYIAKHPLQSHQLRTWQVHQNGQDWYVVTFGAFNARSTAISTAKKLPTEFAGRDPWVRPYHGLKKTG